MLLVDVLAPGLSSNQIKPSQAKTSWQANSALPKNNLS
jgi:hypothetical protein